MPQTVDEVLQQAVFYTDNQPYTLIRLPKGAIMAAAGVVAEISEPFCALIIDKDEVTLIIPAEALADFSARLPGRLAAEQPYRLITLDLPLDLALVGLMARLSSALAGAGISILPLAAYSRDHLLVPENQVQEALAVLEKLKAKH